MTLNPFLNSDRQLRNGWWVLIFFLLLAAFLLPMIMIAQENQEAVSMGRQALIILLASLITQLARRKPLAELFGTLNLGWLKELCVGGLIGAAMMLGPALALGMFGWVDWRWNPMTLSALFSSVLLFAGVAIAEELLFRGFIFQRLISGLGQWPAQWIIAAFFLLTHSNNPGMTGGVKVMASMNIFLASILFGMALIRTKSLAMPLGLHWMANWVQGSILGFGVSGTQQTGLFVPIFGAAPVWLTGGPFGLEASLPGLICVVITLLLLHRKKPTTNS
ncbi:MAG TPA: CPBP family intramembrane glutamic endopeptidase [Anaerolineales bacterium]|nr:CPBP family intramembrane glutamic endopeptidase [Anaerolineales bacterium]